MTAANEMERVRLRAHQVLAFSEVMQERLGSSCTIDAVGDVCSRIADKMRRLGAACFVVTPHHQEPDSALLFL